MRHIKFKLQTATLRAEFYCFDTFKFNFHRNSSDLKTLHTDNRKWI